MKVLIQHGDFVNGDVAKTGVCHFATVYMPPWACSNSFKFRE